MEQTCRVGQRRHATGIFLISHQIVHTREANDALLLRLGQTDATSFRVYHLLAYSDTMTLDCAAIAQRCASTFSFHLFSTLRLLRMLNR